MIKLREIIYLYKNYKSRCGTHTGKVGTPELTVGEDKWSMVAFPFLGSRAQQQGMEVDRENQKQQGHQASRGNTFARA